MHAQHVVGRAPVGQRHRTAVGAHTADARVRKVRHLMRDAISMQSACNQYAINMQSACNQHAISRKCAKFVTVSTPQRKRGRTSVLLSTCASASAVRTCRTADGPDEGRNQPQPACTQRCERRAHLQQLMVDQSEVRMHERVGHAPDEERNQHAIRDALSMQSACTQRRNRVRSGSACA